MKIVKKKYLEQKKWMMKSVLGMAVNNSGEIKENNEQEEVEEVKLKMQDGSSMWLWNSPRIEWKGEF